jgi:hypothetical protein
MKLFEIPMLVTSLFGLCLLSGLDTPPAYADFTFGERVNLKTTIPVLDPAHTLSICFSHDGLEIYITSSLWPGPGDVYVLRRASIDDDWDPPENLGPVVNSPQNDELPSISADGLTLYFGSGRSGGYGGSYDIYMTTRATKNDLWGPPLNLGPKINSYADDSGPVISPDGLELYFLSWRTGGYGSLDIYVARRATQNDPWGNAVNLGPVVNSAYGETYLSLSADGLLLLFTDIYRETPRPGGYGSQDIWMTRRASLSAPWESPVNLGPTVNGPAYDWAPCISPDGRTFYYATALTLDPSTWDCWQVPILPVVDFYPDWSVNMKDFSELAQYWGQDAPSVDIGPMPWGDGVVDIQDLAVLLEYWLSWY